MYPLKVIACRINFSIFWFGWSWVTRLYLCAYICRRIFCRPPISTVPVKIIELSSWHVGSFLSLKVAQAVSNRGILLFLFIFSALYRRATGAPLEAAFLWRPKYSRKLDGLFWKWPTVECYTYVYVHIHWTLKTCSRLGPNPRTRRPDGLTRTWSRARTSTSGLSASSSSEKTDVET
jgi:hypothetical protein